MTTERDSSEREAIARIAFDARFAEVEGWSDDARQANRELTEPTHLRIADAILAAGFTRGAHHDGEPRDNIMHACAPGIAFVPGGEIKCVACLVERTMRERDESNAQYWRLHAAAKLAEIHAAEAVRIVEAERDRESASNRSACDALMQQMRRTDEVIAERDEARAAKAASDRSWAAAQSRVEEVESMYHVLRAESDALAADFASTLRQADEDRAYLRERAEAAEEQVAMRDMALDHLQGRYDAAEAKLAEAAALAEALREIAKINPTLLDFALRIQAASVRDLARAALAGNGNGTGEG